MSTTACESRRRDKEVSDEEVSARSVASGAERHRSGAPNMPLPGTGTSSGRHAQTYDTRESPKLSAALPPEIPDDDSSVAAP